MMQADNEFGDLTYVMLSEFCLPIQPLEELTIGHINWGRTNDFFEML